MQVADAVGDEKRSTWIGMLADRTLATGWQQSGPAEHMLCSLLSLPAHLLHAVLTSCLMEMSVFPLLNMLPTALHPECLSAAISAQKGSLDLRELNAFGLAKALMHLRTASPPPPGLVSLSHIDPIFGPGEFSLATSALLARALAAHTTLRELNLSLATLGSEWLTNFSLCLATSTLPQLTLLGIGIDSADGGCAALAGCLKHLPTLHELEVLVQVDEPPPGHLGRSALAAFARPAACPATLSHLRKLVFREHNLAVDEYTDDSDAGDDGTPVSSCILQLLPLFTAPALSTVSLRSKADSISHSGLVAALAMFPALHTVDIEDGPRRSGSVTLSRPRQQLPSLQALCVSYTTRAASLPLAATIVSHASASMTSLSLDLSVCLDAAPSTALREGWGALLGALASCNHLQWLHLGNLHRAGADARALMTQTVEHLTGLTGLSLGGHLGYSGGPGADTSLCGSQLGRALRCLAKLERLSLALWADIDLRGKKARDVLHACAELPCLTMLELSHGFDICHVAAVLPDLRRLTRLGLPGVQSADGSVLAAIHGRCPQICIHHTTVRPRR